MTKATEDQLAALHGKVAENMISALEQADEATALLVKYYDDKNLPSDVRKFLSKIQVVSPSLLTAITKFLKDNNISSDVTEDENLSELQKRLSEKRKGNVTSISFTD